MAHIYPAKILAKIDLGDSTYALRLRAPELAAQASPGQFVMVRSSYRANGFEPITPRPYSIFSRLWEDDRPTGITLVIKVLGKGGTAILSHAVGESLQLNGPLGNSLDITPGRRYAMAAGGTGIAPVAFAAQEMSRRNIPYTIFYGGRTRNQLFLDELENIGLSAIPATEDGSLGHKGLVTEVLAEDLRKKSADTVAFACGPWNMMRAATDVASRAGVECYCCLERYMACGIGVCLACIYKKTTDELNHTCCKEGPVVAGREVIWDV